ncbi:hypothetical protein T12_11686 [Trichinella patagoniensis]|uniref:Uncharacterized protein n=1 Tax=Trichinella patagoniensis TaxID=990121 RepID=A0A0V0ZQD3_9BILA|nr:hypothetical protein T12_11686 [Trichinella patagoniensis]
MVFIAPIYRSISPQGGPGGLLRGGFDPLPQRTISDRRALGSMTERHAVQQWLLHRVPSELHF